MAKETLYCETGNHKWTRESTRGRKPTTCPKHPRVVAVTQSDSSGNTVRTLHCQIGNHDWKRPAQRGRVPDNCPEHKPVVPQAIRNESPNTLHCEAGNHDWKRPPTRGRKPLNCPIHSGNQTQNTVPQFSVQEISDEELPLVEVEGEYEPETTEAEQRALLSAAFNPPTVKRKPGRPRVHQTQEEAEQAALERSRAKVDHLEESLKAHGTHLSQQAPYSLYKLVRGTAGEPDADYQFVRDFSPLAKAQFINQFPDRFNSGIYYFTKDGEKVDE